MLRGLPEDVPPPGARVEIQILVQEAPEMGLLGVCCAKLTY